METGKFDDIRRSPPEKVAEHQRWTPYAANGATLADLRKLCGKTQEEVGKAMGISGVEAGRMEKRSDVQVTTLVRYLRALGGELEVYARFDEKLVPLKIGEFSIQRFAEFVADGVEAGTWEKGARLEAIRKAFVSVYPLQPEPTKEQIQVALGGAKEILLAERKKPKLAVIVEYLKGQARG